MSAFWHFKYQANNSIMRKISGYNIPLHQEVISDFIYHIRRHVQSRGLQYEFKVAP
jgi:hypothetical protein